MLIASLMVAHLNFIFVPVKYADKIEPLSDYSSTLLCSEYRQWQTAFNKRVKAILDDEIQYLTWKEFVSIQEGNKVEEMENLCRRAGE